MTLLTRHVSTAERWKKAVKLFLVLAGPGLIVMIADNDAGGITTYAEMGDQFGFSLDWFIVLFLLLPIGKLLGFVFWSVSWLAKQGGFGRKIEDISGRYRIPANRMTSAVEFCLLVFKFVLTLAGK